MSHKCIYTCILQYGMQFYWYLCENVKLESNKVDNFEALYCTMALITLEMGCREVSAEIIRLALDMQVSGILSKFVLYFGRGRYNAVWEKLFLLITVKACLYASCLGFTFMI